MVGKAFDYMLNLASSNQICYPWIEPMGELEDRGAEDEEVLTPSPVSRRALCTCTKGVEHAATASQSSESTDDAWWISRPRLGYSAQPDDSDGTASWSSLCTTPPISYDQKKLTASATTRSKPTT